MKKGSGVLLHVSSLPSSFGVGDFGPTAYEFVDFLQKAGQTYWQLLPLTPTDSAFGNSPYSSPSAFALSPLFISPELLAKEGLLNEEDLKIFDDGSAPRVNYAEVARARIDLMQKAFQRFNDSTNWTGFRNFCHEHSFWLDTYADFMILKKKFPEGAWNRWPDEFKKRRSDAMANLRKQFSGDILFIKFLQFKAFQQWEKLKVYASQHQVQIIGDIPIYVNYDSADVWAAPDFFKLDEDYSPVYVAGVPPDYFSKTGQRWGNPVYDWQKLATTGFSWWLKRLDHTLRLFDIIRIDHFRGFIAFWQIPAAEETAINGEWEEAPAEEFFSAIKKKYPDLPIIAEDLGIITEDVEAAMKKFGFPGMKILQFAFGEDIKTHGYIPENYDENCIAYTGTHDNNTTNGWFNNDATQKDKENLIEYFGKFKVSDLPWLFIKALMNSKATIVIFPIQDFLGLGEDARMNLPGTASGNWEWRLAPKSLSVSLAKKIYILTKSFHRI